MPRRDTDMSASRATINLRDAGNIGYEDKGKTAVGSYEPAPKDNINENTDDVQKLTKLQSEI